MSWLDNIEKKNSCPTWPEAPLCPEVKKLIAAVRLAEHETNTALEENAPPYKTVERLARLRSRLRSGDVGQK